MIGINKNLIAVKLFFDSYQKNNRSRAINKIIIGIC